LTVWEQDKSPPLRKEQGYNNLTQKIVSIADSYDTPLHDHLNDAVSFIAEAFKGSVDKFMFIVSRGDHAAPRQTATSPSTGPEAELQPEVVLSETEGSSPGR